MRFLISGFLVQVVQASFFSTEPTAVATFHSTDDIGPVRFVFSTSNLTEYDSSSMQIRITLAFAKFTVSTECSNVIGATGGFPALDSCAFTDQVAVVKVQTPFQGSQSYSLTILLRMPTVELPDLNGNTNSFDFAIEYETSTVIEHNMNPVVLTSYVYSRAQNTGFSDSNGWVTDFKLVSQDGYSTLNSIIFVFSISSVGIMNNRFAIDIVAHPTDVWNLGTVNTACPEYNSLRWVSGSSCTFQNYAGASSSTQANGFRIGIDSPAADNMDNAQFKVRLNSPVSAVNMIWVAQSVRTNSLDLNKYPQTVLLEIPIHVVGAPLGGIAAWQIEAVGVAQWVNLLFYPDNTISPILNDGLGGSAGSIVIYPPEGFRVIDTDFPEAVSGMNALTGSWIINSTSNSWEIRLIDITAFKETLYGVRLKVDNRDTPSSALSWTIVIEDQNAFVDGVASLNFLAASRDIRGFPIYTTMTAKMAHSNELISVSNLIRFSLVPTASLGREIGTKILIEAPSGFVFQKRCPGFRAIKNIPETSTVCKGGNNEIVTLTFTDINVIVSGQEMAFDIEVVNPVEVTVGDDAGNWYFYTYHPDETGVNVVSLPGFAIYPSEMTSVVVSPTLRLEGPQDVVVKFKPSTDIPMNDYIKIRAPSGVVWGALNTFTSTGVVDSNSFSLANPAVVPGSGNTLFFQVTERLTANFQYAIKSQIIVPSETQNPNTWWVEQYRLTGDVDNPTILVSAKGGDGFKTQVLVDPRVIPYNNVQEAWDNFMTVVFTTTASAQSLTGRPASFTLDGPPGFTFICPIAPYGDILYVKLPDETTITPFADDTQCNAKDNFLQLTFNVTGLVSGLSYAFVVNTVNALSVSPESNKYTLSSWVGSTRIEKGEVAGFALSRKLTKTAYISVSTREDRRALVDNNELTFAVGLTVPMPAGSYLEVKAPQGFTLATDDQGSCDVEGAVYMGTSGYQTFPLPTLTQCESPPGQTDVARLWINATLSAVTSSLVYAISVIAKNPANTPAFNYWKITIYDSSLTPVMGESWIQGFLIQEIKDVSLYPYNAGTAISGESAPNPIDVFFQTTTQIPQTNGDSGGGRIVLSAPTGFYFPPVCRYFALDVFSTDRGTLPEGTTCAGSSSTSVRLRTPAGTVVAPGQYSFRVLVENPAIPFSDPSKYPWAIATYNGAGDSLIDSDIAVVGFPVRQRAKYFLVTALSNVGRTFTVLKLSFSIYSDLQPGNKIVFTSPTEIDLTAIIGLPCVYPDPANGDPPSDFSSEALALQLNAQFGKSLLSDVAQLPSYVSCNVTGPQAITITNNEPLRKGRPLLAGPTYEQILTNVLNPQSTPLLNLWRLEAFTSNAAGPETWSADGYFIYPELSAASVTSSNPGYGLFTNFTFSLQGVTTVPEGGSIKITAPSTSYYFGLRLANNASANDPLSTIPPSAGSPTPRSSSASNTCVVYPPSAGFMNCPLEFVPCLDALALIKSKASNPSTDTTELASLQTNCASMNDYCVNGQFHSSDPTLPTDKIFYCSGSPGSLEITLGSDTRLSAGTTLQVSVQGYNEDVQSRNNTWYFVTRDSDSSKSVLDRKSVTGYDMNGVIFVDLISPSETRVSISDNLVEVHLRLSTTVLQPGRLIVRFPVAFSQDSTSQMNVSTYGAFPPKLDWRANGNEIQIDSKNDALPRDSTLILTLTLSNPQISPSDANNNWEFVTMSLAQATLYQPADVNYDVAGFRVFGAFKTASLAPRMLSPTVANTLGVWFSLESDLPRDSVNPTSYLVLVLPFGFTSIDDTCGTGIFNAVYQRYDDAEVAFSVDKHFAPLPGGSLCTSLLDDTTGRLTVKIAVDNSLDYGIDYAFQIGVKNPKATPLYADNYFEFQTQLSGVVLHLMKNVEGFSMRSLRLVSVTPSDSTSKKPLDLITLNLQSAKYIPGNAFILLTAPSGFVFTCTFVDYVNLAPTTTCAATKNVVKFTLDGEDAKDPLEIMKIKVYTTNPEFTPQPNLWEVAITTALGSAIDVAIDVKAFDITGTVNVTITPQFTYKNHRNQLTINFLPNTIMNRADYGNELVISAPNGFTFPTACSHFSMSPVASAISGYPIPSDYVFPPEGTQCIGSDNNTLIVRFPSGAGLQKYWYNLDVDVINAASNPSGSSSPAVWTFETRVENDEVSKIVDVNPAVVGFAVTDLVINEIGAANRGSSLYAGFWIVIAIVSLMRTTN